MTRERIAAAFKEVNSVPQEDIDKIEVSVKKKLSDDKQNSSITSNEYTENIVNQVRDDVDRELDEADDKIIAAAMDNSCNKTHFGMITKDEYVQCLPNIKKVLSEMNLPMKTSVSYEIESYASL
ncbi:hypothetical protein N0K21_13375 [Yersinia aleksiciae]|nr:hypothetical protein N0K21_13375 [Yersinia aleksiciae]